MSKFQRNKRIVMFKVFFFTLLRDPLNAWSAAREAGDALEIVRKVFNQRRRAQGEQEGWLE